MAILPKVYRFKQDEPASEGEKEVCELRFVWSIQMDNRPSHDLQWKHEKLRALLQKSEISETELEQVFDSQALTEFYSIEQAKIVQETIEALKRQASELETSITHQKLMSSDLQSILSQRNNARNEEVPPGRIDQLKSDIRHVMLNFTCKANGLDPDEAEKLINGLMTYELGFVVPRTLQTVQYFISNHLVDARPAESGQVVLKLW